MFSPVSLDVSHGVRPFRGERVNLFSLPNIIYFDKDQWQKKIEDHFNSNCPAITKKALRILRHQIED
jgi:hypothetical protein